LHKDLVKNAHLALTKNNMKETKLQLLKVMPRVESYKFGHLKVLAIYSK